MNCDVPGAPIVAAIRQPAFLYGPDGTILAANEPAEALAGRSLAGCSAADVVRLGRVRRPDGTPLDPGRLPASRALAGEEVTEQPAVITAADGRELHVLVSASPIREGGRVVGALCVWQDVTERTNAEETLEEERGRLQAVLDGMTDAYYVYDREWRFVEINQHAADYFGRPREELLGRTVWELYPHTVGGPTWTEYHRAVAEGVPVHFETASGVGPRFFEVHAYPRPDGLTVYVRDITGRKRAGEALREREQQLDLALEGAGAGMWVRDLDRGWIASPQMNALFGLPRDAPPLREEEFPAFIHPDDLPALGEAWLAALEGGSSYSREYRVVWPDGSVHWLGSEGRTVADCGGTPRFIGVTYDVTGRKRAEGALRRSEARQALLAEVGGRLLAAWEPQAVVDDLCRRALAVLDCDVFFNYLADEASGRLVLNAYGGIPPGEAARIRRLDLGTAVCGCAARDGCRIVAEAIPENPDPRTELVAGFGVRAYACHPLLVGGRSIGTLSFGTRTRDRFADDELATMRAIADLIAVAMQRIADRDALRASEERLRLAQESAGLGSWDHDLVSDRVTLSPMFLGRYGMTAKAVACYEDWDRLIHPGDRERVEAGRRAALPAGQPLDFDFRVVLPSGDERWVQFRGRGSANGPGGHGRVLGVVLDVTARKQAEIALERNAADLRASNEELQRFAYVASHDLQEPLRSIVSFSQLLKRRYGGKLDADADDYIGFIVDGGMRMQALIQDLLQFSRIETQARTPVPADAGAAVRSALRTLEASAREGGSTVTVDPLPTVMADPAQLELVFANLIGNAIKYRRPDEPLLVRVGARRTDGFWEFSVSDNGIGIEPEYFDRIFEMFRRLHTHDKYDGTGIGLAVVKRIVERHGGAVRVESTPGEGSTFFFTLPAA